MSRPDDIADVDTVQKHNKQSIMNHVARGHGSRIRERPAAVGRGSGRVRYLPTVDVVAADVLFAYFATSRCRRHRCRVCLMCDLPVSQTPKSVFVFACFETYRRRRHRCRCVNMIRDLPTYFADVGGAFFISHSLPTSPTWTSF